MASPRVRRMRKAARVAPATPVAAPVKEVKAAPVAKAEPKAKKVKKPSAKKAD